MPWIFELSAWTARCPTASCAQRRTIFSVSRPAIADAPCRKAQNQHGMLQAGIEGAPCCPKHEGASHNESWNPRSDGTGDRPSANGSEEHPSTDTRHEGIFGG